jgi:hypothetical protein
MSGSVGEVVLECVDMCEGNRTESDFLDAARVFREEDPLSDLASRSSDVTEREVVRTLIAPRTDWSPP